MIIPEGSYIPQRRAGMRGKTAKEEFEKLYDELHFMF